MSSVSNNVQLVNYYQKGQIAKPSKWANDIITDKQRASVDFYHGQWWLDRMADVEIYRPENAQSQKEMETAKIKNETKFVADNLLENLGSVSTEGNWRQSWGASLMALGLGEAAVGTKIFIGSAGATATGVGAPAGGPGMAIGGGLVGVGGATYYGGASLLSSGSEEQIKFLKELQKIENYKANTQKTPRVEVKASTLGEKWACLDNRIDMPSQEKGPSGNDLLRAATKNGKQRIQTSVYVTPNGKEKDAVQTTQIKISTMDLGEYDGATPKRYPRVDDMTMNKKGYYTLEYDNIPTTFKPVIDAFFEGQSDSIKPIQINALRALAQALNTKGYKDEIEIFDVTGDGHTNSADYLAMGYMPDELENKGISVQNIVATWKKTGSFEKTLKQLLPKEKFKDEDEMYSVRNKLRELFDVNGDKGINDKDLAFFGNLNSNGAEDWNADGIIDKKDVIILKNFVDGLIVTYNKEAERRNELIKTLGYDPAKK